MPSFTALSLFALSLFAPLASATISITSPIASTKCKGGATCQITWQEDGDTPKISDFGPVTVGLYVGNRLQQTLLQDFGTVDDPSKTLLLGAHIDPASGPSGNDYFVRFQSVSAKDDNKFPLQSFSAKFAISGMNGTFSQAIQNQIAGVTSGVSAPSVITATGGQAASVSNLAQTAAPSATKNASSDDSAAGRTSVVVAVAFVGSALAFFL